MNIKEFIGNYKNHPVLFIGTGISLRYLQNSFTWDSLLKSISFELTNNAEDYLDLKARNQQDGKYNFEKIALELEDNFNKKLSENRNGINGKFKEINDLFYENMKKDLNISRFKIYISKLFSEIKIKENMKEEISDLKRIRKNIGSIITTNYDELIEKIFDFDKLIGNNILLSNPYGSIYKIHGCTTAPDKIIITEKDYTNFDQKYELIRAQLLSLFIHHPIIFLGYGIGDNNIKKILKTIFTYVEPNSELAKNIRNNFLLVEYKKNLRNVDISEHDIDMEGFSTIRINKLKTDDFQSLYKALSDIHLPISAMDIRKVQSIVSEIYSGGKIEVKITEDLENLKNKDKIIAIGSSKTISYQYQNVAELMANYFKILEESNHQILFYIDKHIIQSNQYFPIFGFSSINTKIKAETKLKEQQERNVNNFLNSIKENHKKIHSSISGILSDTCISTTYKTNSIVWNVMNNNISIHDLEEYLKKMDNKKTTDFRRLLCTYDIKKYKK